MSAVTIPKYENLGPDDADTLAERLDTCDHIVLRNSAPNPDDDMIETVLTADENNFLVRALRTYAKARRWGDFFNGEKGNGDAG